MHRLQRRVAAARLGRGDVLESKRPAAAAEGGFEGVLQHPHRKIKQPELAQEALPSAVRQPLAREYVRIVGGSHPQDEVAKRGDHASEIE